MTTPDRSLTPADAAVAVRSFPRRFRAVFARPDGDDERFDPDEAARRPGSDGRSAAEHLLTAVRLVDAIPALGSDTAHDTGGPVGDILERLTTAAERAAARIDAVPTEQWSGQLEATQDAVAAIAAHLRAAQRTMDEVT